MSIPEEHVTRICRPGSGAATCAYLTFSPVADQWECAKTMPGIRTTIAARLAAGTMNAQGDNCPGFFESALPPRWSS